MGLSDFEYDEGMTAEENIARGLFAIAKAIREGARHLGTENAATPMGAIELLSSEVKDGFASLSQAIESIADQLTGRD